MSSTLPSHPPKRVLVPRAEARRQLGGISAEGIRGLEDRGILKLIKLTQAKQGHGFYTQDNIDAVPDALLAQAEAEAQAKAEPSAPVEQKPLAAAQALAP